MSVAPGWGRGPLISVDSKNFQDLCEEVLDLRQKVTQRGARLQVLREWLREVDWIHFCDDHPEAKGWFDNDGVPK